jgi:hypothetical protein
VVHGSVRRLALWGDAVESSMNAGCMVA